MYDDGRLGGGHTVRSTDHLSQKCTLETYILLLVNVIPINVITHTIPKERLETVYTASVYISWARAGLWGPARPDEEKCSLSWGRPAPSGKGVPSLWEEMASGRPQCCHARDSLSCLAGTALLERLEGLGWRFCHFMGWFPALCGAVDPSTGVCGDTGSVWPLVTRGVSACSHIRSDHVHCSVIFNSQDLGAAEMSISR